MYGHMHKEEPEPSHPIFVWGIRLLAIGLLFAIPFGLGIIVGRFL